MHCPTEEVGRTLRRTGERQKAEGIALAVDGTREPELEELKLKLRPHP